MKLRNLAAASALALAVSAAPALAQDAGVTIIGNDDAPVGTVVSNDGTTVLIDTGKNQVPLPPAAFAEREGKWTMNITKAGLDAAYEAQQAQLAEQEAARKAAEAQAKAEAAAALAAALVEGAEVVSMDAMPLGAVKTLQPEAIVLVAEDASLMTLPRNLFAINGDGALIVRANHADIMAALNGA